jgi:hypothetical protein
MDHFSRIIATNYLITFATFSSMNRLPIRLLQITTIVILTFMAIYFIFRNPLLNRVVYSKADRFNKTHEANIGFSKVSFNGLTTLHFDSLWVTPGSNDTLLFIGSLSARMNCRQILTGHIGFKKLQVEQALFHIDQNKMEGYYRAFGRSNRVIKNTSSKSDLSGRAGRLLKRILTKIPSTLIINDASVSYVIDTIHANWYIENFRLKNENIESVIRLNNPQKSQKASIDGKFKPKKWTFQLSVNTGEEGIRLQSPLASLFGAAFHYTSLRIDVMKQGKKKKDYSFEGNCSLGPFDLEHRALSSKNLLFPGCTMKLDFAIGPNYFELDSNSAIHLGKLTLHPYLKYSTGPSDSLIFCGYVPSFSVNDFYSAFPSEMFPELSYIKAKGSLSFRTKLLVDLNQPDSLYLESHLDSKDFKLTYIDAELLKMNTPFVYTAWEKGKPVRSFQVGPGNPDYCPLDQVPVLMQNAVLTAEDGSFYFHKGFLTESIQYALAQNIKRRKFVRGGSTISQQLVKNVYLSREKTLSRKFEEIVLVWIIESNRLVPKSRMFEVYLNIIEWGPGVYGIKEASRFYFDKAVSQLNAEECIFLASVIPSPKKFYYRFDKEGRLAPFMLAYYNDMSDKLFRKGLISSADGDSLSSVLRITGPAIDFLHTNIVPADSISMHEFQGEGWGE